MKKAMFSELTASLQQALEHSRGERQDLRTRGWSSPPENLLKKPSASKIHKRDESLYKRQKK